MRQRSIFNDIRFWLAVLFIIRLYGITQPPLEYNHNWRQTDVTMAVRNFVEVDNNILYPRIDIAGAQSGIAGMEFPILNYMVYLIVELFGYQHWYGRLITLIFSSIGLLYFFKLIRKYFSQDTAFYATLILAVSIWFQFSRKIMPDTFALSLIITGMYFGSNYLDGKSSRNSAFQLLFYFILIVLGTLSKISGAYILVIFILFYFDKRISLHRLFILGSISLLAIIPTIIWHFYWTPYLVDTYGCKHFFLGVPFVQGFHEVLHNLPWTIRRFCETAMGFSGFAIFIFGVYIAVRKRNTQILWLLILSTLSFLPIVIKTGDNFMHHDYYVIPYIPIMAFIGGYGLSKIRLKYLTVLILIVICTEGIGRQVKDFRIQEEISFLSTLEQELDKVSSRDDLILINSGHSPTAMYFSHRKGWSDFNYNIEQPKFVDKLSEQGLKYILITKHAFDKDLALPYLKLIDNENYSFYQIDKKL